MDTSGGGLLREGATQDRGEEARLQTLVGAIAISDMVKTTLGPKGMDKILQSMSGDMKITNDGATILKSVVVENAAARVLIDISRVQDETIGDGTTSVCVLAGEILRQAQILLAQHLHPMVIIDGFRRATDIARKALEDHAQDNKADEQRFRQDLMDIARTTLSSKILTTVQQHFADLAVEAVFRLKGDTNISHIQIIKKSGGTLGDSYLDDGFILDKSIGLGCPKTMQNATVLIANTALDSDKIKITGARVRVDSHAKLEEIEAAEKARIEQKCEKIIRHGINVFINRQLIYDVPMQYFAKNGVLTIEHADFDGVERLSLVLGDADIASTFDAPEQVKLGHCDRVEEIMIGEDRLIKFSGVPNSKASTIILRGASNYILGEAERSLHDALCVLSQTAAKESRIVYGAGCSETIMANAIEMEARTVQGKTALVLEAFSKALRALPVTIANNGGYDGEDLAASLRALHFEGKSTHGLDMKKGSVLDAKEAGITESFMCKLHVLLYASEAAEQILRVDSIVNCAPRREG